MQLWKHPNGIFYVLHGPRLRQRTSTGTRDRREAETCLAQFIASEDSAPVTSPTVGQILKGYEADHGPRVRAPGTLHFSVKALHDLLAPLRPDQLMPPVIRKYAKDRGRAPGTILREIGTLRAALAWAQQHGWIAAFPHIPNPVKAPPPRDRWITKDEARALIAACREPHVRTFVILGLMTGARMGAILELTWDRVDFARGLVDFGLGHGNKRRVVAPLNGELRRALEAAREVSCGDRVVEWHGRPVSTIKNGFAKAAARAGLADVTPHILRHSAATWMSLDGVPLAEIARLLGDDEATVERVYAKHTPDYLRRATRALQLSDEPPASAVQLKGIGAHEGPQAAE